MSLGQEKLSHTALEQAAQWYVLLLDDPQPEARREQWQQWLAQHADNQAAWCYMERVGTRFAPLRTEGERAGHLLRTAESPALSRRHAVKALLLLGCASLTGLGVATRGGWTADLRTATAENRKFILADDLTLWMGACSAVDTYFNEHERRVVLRYGEVLLHSRNAGDSLALNTDCGRLLTRSSALRLAVNHRPGITRLNLYEGELELYPLQGAPVLVHAGQQVSFDARGVRAIQAAQPGGQSWLQRLLTADALPLAELIHELSRYREGHLGINPLVADLKVMGTFPLDDTDQALALLQAALPVRIERFTDWWVTVEPA